MVASFMEKTVSKSYVRLPGSGSDKTAGTSFCDLSRGSSLAASISVPQNMGKQRYLNTKLIPTAQNKRPRSEDDSAATNTTIKRACLDNIVQNTPRTPTEPTIQPLTVTAAPVIASPQIIASNFIPSSNTTGIQTLRQPQNPTPVYIIREAGPDVKKLQEENEKLKSENASLQKQLSLFKQLMRNPQRLQSVVQRLNERQN